MNQEDNEAPQPTISHLETDLNNSTAVVYARLWTFLDLANTTEIAGEQFGFFH